ncbi:MAG: hypothetical protein HY505_00210 [Candidatus Yanofskybacteria bacterium]|nr:hypothetical protein [Candidatus Yanofskybacteria bacterium]
MSKQNLTRVGLVVILIVSVVVGYYFFYGRSNKQEFDIRGFNGDVVSIEGERIILNGTFEGFEALPGNFVSERDFSLSIDDATQFTKVDIGWPSWDEVDDAGGTLTFNIASLSYTEGPGSLADLKATSELNPGTVYVEAEFQSSIYEAEIPVASHIFYRLMSMPIPTSSGTSQLQ